MSRKKKYLPYEPSWDHTYESFAARQAARIKRAQQQKAQQRKLKEKT